MPAGLPETASSVGAQIGRYFSLASLLPSLLFVTWFVALRGAAPPFGEFDLAGAQDALTEWSLGEVGLVLAASLLLGFVVHPFMFATTQVFEGYWGPRMYAVRLAAWFAQGHRRRQDQLEDRQAAVGLELRRQLDDISLEDLSPLAFEKLTPDQRKERRARVLASPKGAHLHGQVLARDFMRKSLEVFPARADRILPTRLGNALRHVEDSVGQQYALDLITIAPHLAVSAVPARAAYVDDSREQLDVSVRLAFYGLLAAALSTLWLLGSGWGLLIALIPYTFAYLAYRGAVSAAGEWGAAIAACVDLDRFAMYDAMRLELPENTHAERIRNVELVKLLQGNRQASIAYLRPPSGSS
jgi:hypothetical protein